MNPGNAPTVSVVMPVYNEAPVVAGVIGAGLPESIRAVARVARQNGVPCTVFVPTLKTSNPLEARGPVFIDTQKQFGVALPAHSSQRWRSWRVAHPITRTRRGLRIQARRRPTRRTRA